MEFLNKLQKMREFRGIISDQIKEKMIEKKREIEEDMQRERDFKLKEKRL